MSKFDRSFRAAGDAGVERDPAGVAPHHLQDHHPVVALGRRVQPVDGIGGHGHRRVKAEGVVGGGEVVVDGFRDGHHGDAHVAEALGDAQRAVAADGDDAFDPQLADPLHDLAGAVDADGVAVRVEGRVLERIAAVCRPQQRAPLRQDAADDLGGHRDGLPGQQPFEAELDAEHLHAVIPRGGADSGADDGVEAGTVASAGEDADSRHHSRFIKSQTSRKAGVRLEG
jgi:hypothetical protein